MFRSASRPVIIKRFQKYFEKLGFGILLHKRFGCFIHRICYIFLALKLVLPLSFKTKCTKHGILTEEVEFVNIIAATAIKLTGR